VLAGLDDDVVAGVGVGVTEITWLKL
jgi:hypothetical protein